MGADVNQLDNEGKTPLYRAVDKGNTKVVTALIEAGADVNEAKKVLDEKSPFTRLDRLDKYVGLEISSFLSFTDAGSLCCTSKKSMPTFTTKN